MHGTTQRCMPRHTCTRHGTAVHATAQRCMPLHNGACHGTAVHVTTQRSTPRHSGAYHISACHDTTVHATSVHSTTQRCIPLHCLLSAIVTHSNDLLMFINTLAYDWHLRLITLITLRKIYWKLAYSLMSRSILSSPNSILIATINIAIRIASHLC